MPRLSITNRPRSRDELAEWYAEALNDQATSGLSVADYAERIGVSGATLYQWRRRLAPDDDDRSGLTRPAGLIEVTLEAERSADLPGPFTVHLGRDRSIELPPQFDDNELRRLINVLESC